MGKIAQLSSKYIVNASIDIEGVVDKPDVIGAIFGQTEGLLGSDLELRELQRSGRIGRIEVNVETRSGKTTGSIIIPSSLDKAETAIVGASLEIIQRIGPCNAKIKVENIEDVRVSKRTFVIERAKTLLKNLMAESMPDSQEISEEVAASVRIMEIQEYGKERLPAGPNIKETEEIIIVEGRADVVNLLKYGIKNVIAMNGTSVPETIIELCRKKIVTAFLDGDRGGDLMIRDLLSNSEVDYIAKAPSGMEVEEITQKEILKALRGRISAEQANLEVGKKLEKQEERQNPPQSRYQPRPAQPQKYQPRPSAPPARRAPFRFQKKEQISPNEKKKFSDMLGNLVGTRGAHIVDEKLNILGKVPISELSSTISNLGTGIHAVILDGSVEKDIVDVAEKAGVKYLIGMDSKIKPQDTKVNILTVNDL